VAKKATADGFLVNPFVVVIDSTEQMPYSFATLRSDAKDGGLPLRVQTETHGLSSGDYSLKGFEGEIAVERKGGPTGVEDLYATLGQRRAQFERELARLACYAYSAVVVEADWNRIINHPPVHSRLNPKTVYRSVVAWQQRYPGTHWWLCPGRQFAEVTTYRILERYHRDRVSAPRPAGQSYATWMGRQLAAAMLDRLDAEGLDLTGFSEADCG
jgi:hypothetical protein